MSAVAIPRRALLAPLLAALAMFGPFCIDAIFPAFPAMARQFDALQAPVATSLVLTTALAAVTTPLLLVALA